MSSTNWRSKRARGFNKKQTLAVGWCNELFETRFSENMNEPNPQRLENLIRVHKVQSQWQGNAIVDYLRSNGMEATLEVVPSVPPLDVAEEFSGSDKTGDILVLQHDAERARALIAEFLARQPPRAER